MRYFDTGVLLKLYLPEPRAAEAVAFVNASPGKPPVNHLHELEMRSALRQKAGRGELTEAECDALIKQLESGGLKVARSLRDRMPKPGESRAENPSSPVALPKSKGAGASPPVTTSEAKHFHGR